MDEMFNKLRPIFESAGYTLTSRSITENVTICRAGHEDGTDDEVVASFVGVGMLHLARRLGLRQAFFPCDAPGHSEP